MPFWQSIHFTIILPNHFYYVIGHDIDIGAYNTISNVDLILIYRSEDWPEDSKNGPSKDQGNYDAPGEPEGALDTNWHEVVESFDDMNLKEELLRGIYAYGFEKPSAIQQRAIMPCILKRDVIAQAQSGTGKTATFSISILQQIDTSIRECQALILAPTRELAQQIQKVRNCAMW